MPRSHDYAAAVPPYPTPWGGSYTVPRGGYGTYGNPYGGYGAYDTYGGASAYGYQAVPRAPQYPAYGYRPGPGTGGSY